MRLGIVLLALTLVFSYFVIRSTLLMIISHKSHCVNILSEYQ